MRSKGEIYEGVECHIAMILDREFEEWRKGEKGRRGGQRRMSDVR